MVVNKRKLEALAEAIAHTSGYYIPDNPLHDARNPGGLRAVFAAHKRDANGHRVFQSFLDGMQALLFDIQTKLEGKSRAKLTSSSTLSDFAIAFGQPAAAAQVWTKFLRRALHDDAISHKTTIEYFFGDKQ
jgi:hypothetical protein